MKSTNALVAAALAGVFAAGTTTTFAARSVGSPVAADAEKDKCDGKDGCKGKDKDKDKDKKEGTLLSISNGADKDKDKCDGKDGCKGKDKDKDKKEGTIL